MPQFLEGWFGHGDDDYPLWLAAVRVNILLVLALWAIVAAWHLSPSRLKAARRGVTELGVVAGLTLVAGCLRFLVAKSNLFDLGGIAYSRLLLGYKGHFATAQFFSLVYQVTARDMEHAILIHRALGTVTVPAIYLLCRLLRPRLRLFPPIAAGILALYPLHIIFSASDTLSVFTIFLSTVSYVLVAGGVLLSDRFRVVALLHYFGGLLGLALVTQARYENVLLLAPVVMGLLIERRRLNVRLLLAPLVIFVAVTALYAVEMISNGVSYQNPLRLAEGIRIAKNDLLLNPFLSLPVLLVGAIAATVRKRDALSTVAPLAVVVGLALVAMTTDSGHHGARVFSSWLGLIIAGSAYGFALLWSETPKWGKPLAALSLVYLAALPIAVRHRLTAQYLEMQEHDYFASVWRNLPADTAWVIVPDDAMMQARYHSTLEELTKYWMIGAGRAGARAKVVGISEYLLEPGEVDCKKDKCLFFYGLPCTPQDVYPFTRSQCEELVKTRRVEVLSRLDTLSAPFDGCSVYVGRAASHTCTPSLRPRSFITYTME